MKRTALPVTLEHQLPWFDLFQVLRLIDACNIWPCSTDREARLDRKPQRNGYLRHLGDAPALSCSAFSVLSGHELTVDGRLSGRNILAIVLSWKVEAMTKNDIVDDQISIVAI